MTILHITDLHLDHFDGDQEFLRKGFYQEYIDRLFLSIQKKETDLKIHYLVITGDFINKGKVENYPDVEKIIDYLAEKFTIEKKNICFAIGNHDYKWKELASANELSLKMPYSDFRKKYIPTPISEGANYFLSKLDEDIFFLSIDSTWNSNDGTPGSFNTTEQDNLIEALKNNTNEKTTLLIGCHFPIAPFDDSFLAMEEQNWHDNHHWSKGASLRDRIRRLAISNIIWFHGDVHASDQKIIEKETFILTSKFGGTVDTSEQRRQAVIMYITEHSLSRLTCSYVFPTHGQHVTLGDWECSEVHELRTITPVQEVKNTTSNILNALNQEVEKEILRLINEKGLYKFGRFHVSEEYVSLGWVDISKLLSDRSLLTRISDKCFDLVRQNLSGNSEEILFIGLEMIGGILASQLSVRFNCKNSIIPLRSKSGHYSELESNHSPAFDDLTNVKDIFIIIDLISSGNSITEFVENLNTVNPNLNIHVISIISNDRENKMTVIPKAKSYNTFCAKLKIPLIKHSEMPDENFVEPNLKF